mgnify:CR=1 FL=1
MCPQRFDAAGKLHAAVFDRVVQQAYDRLVCGATVLEHDSRHADQVRDVGNVRLLSQLNRVQLGRKGQRAAERDVE